MVNTYDILLNFMPKAYEFFEWEKDDNIRQIRKIPSIKVDSKVLLDFMNNICKVDTFFLEEIKDKTEYYNDKKLFNIKYACILYCDDTCCAFIFDDDGIVKGKSKLLFDEADEVLTDTSKIEKKDFNYKIIKKEIDTSLHTRKENKLIENISNYINYIYDKKEYDEINYLYFECFNKMENNPNYSYKKILESVKKADYDILEKITSFMKVLKK